MRRDPYEIRREEMVETIKRHARSCASYTGRETLSERVLEAMLKIPRHEFVSFSDRNIAYADNPLAIGHGQTISQPFIVALMADLLDLKEDDIVLEGGSGCGYHAAILGQLCKEVYTIELIPELAALARKNLTPWPHIHVIEGDGNLGRPEKAPFDAISLAAAADRVPPALLEQLKPGGRMIIPLGERGFSQSLTLVIKDGPPPIPILPVAFVPFVRS